MTAPMVVATWINLQYFASIAVQYLPALFTSGAAFMDALPALIGATVALWVVTLVSAVGFYRIMNSYSIGRTSVNANL